MQVSQHPESPPPAAQARAASDSGGSDYGPAAFSLRRTLKLGTFHIGSSATDLLVSAVWNRIMIVDLGAVAWPVSLLSALRYFLAPISLWAGHRSDTRPMLGSRRLSYIWGGRLVMLLSLPLLPLSTVILARDLSDPLGWGMAFASLSLFGVGTLVSGPAFLALVHDSAPYESRGRAIAVVQLMLVGSFAFLPAAYAALMPEYGADSYLRLALVAMAGSGALWFWSVWREERDPRPDRKGSATLPFRQALGEIWTDGRTRRYALFLGASAFFAFMQDAVLEPFGGDVFGLPVGETTRFNAYWGGGVLLGMLATMARTRDWRPHEHVRTTGWGLGSMAIPLGLLGVAAGREVFSLVRPLLVAFGLGFGVFTAGGVSLLMAMSRERQAGTYLALWSMIQLVSRGSGIALGGALRDLFLTLSNRFSSAYAAVFWVEAVGLLLCVLLLMRVDVRSFAAARTSFTPSEALAAASD